MDFVYFLGRFHVLVLHLPIGILTLAIVFEILTRWRPFAFLKPALPWTWLAGGLAGVATVALGFMHATESGFQDSPAVEAHRMAGITLTLLAFAIWILSLRLAPTAVSVWPDWAKKARLDHLYAKVQPYWTKGGPIDRLYDKSGWIVASVLTFVMMSVTGHLGGNLTHGETYLVQYAPKPIRRLAGLSSETDPRPTPKDLASADIYLDIVGPALHARCDGCHNDGKASGGLSIAEHAKLLKGGKVGAVINPGDPTKSDLFRRINLPTSSGDFMPKDGKTPLTADQTAAVGVWIKAGAPKQGLVASLKLSDADKAVLQKALGASAAPAGDDDNAGVVKAGTQEVLPVVAAANPEAVTALENSGFIVRPLDKKSNLLDVNFTQRRALTDADFANLAKIGPQIRTLSIRDGQVTDGQLKTVAAFPNLVRLRLMGNPVTDAGAASLSGMKTLRQLTLISSKLSDGGLMTVASAPALQRVYVWQTGVTKAGAEKAQAAHPNLKVDLGRSPADIDPNEPKKEAVN